jgi:hypothetical protein
MVLKTRSCSLLTTFNKSSPRLAIACVGRQMPPVSNTRARIVFGRWSGSNFWELRRGKRASGAGRHYAMKKFEKDFREMLSAAE